MKVLFVVSECAPLVKTGGLADVAGALPTALAAEGCFVRVLMPAYRNMIRQIKKPCEVMAFDDLFGDKARVLAGHAGGLDLLLLDAPHLFDRPGSIYLGPDGSDWPDNPFRFAALSWVGAEIGKRGLADGWRPMVVHAHDWQGALTPVYLSVGKGAPAATVLTIHNIAFQGIFGASMRYALRLPRRSFTPQGYEFFGKINFLKAGLVTADALTTVSPTYARELTDAKFGMGLEGVVSARAEHMTGILNGIDVDSWNPETDEHILRFNVRSLKAKRACKDALETEFGVKAKKGAPLFGVVSRLTSQKGLDLLLEALPRLVDRGGGLVLLGSGDSELEEAFKAAAAAHPGRIGVRIAYDEGLSHRIYAGADVIVVPSRFEPCGLTQLYALRYGALPLVSRTGGLADTVIDANDAGVKAGVANGFQFTPESRAALNDALERVFDCYRDGNLWRRMQRNAMKHPVGWDVSAAKYRDLYASLSGSAR